MMGCILCRHLGGTDPITDGQYEVKFFWCCKKANKIIDDINSFPDWCPSVDRDVINDD